MADISLPHQHDSQIKSHNNQPSEVTTWQRQQQRQHLWAHASHCQFLAPAANNSQRPWSHLFPASIWQPQQQTTTTSHQNAATGQQQQLQ